MEHLTIAGRKIGPGQPPYIVAEIGSNHNGDMELCRELINAASESGADAVKFQSWSKGSLFSRGEYGRKARSASANGPTLEQQVERYQLRTEQHMEAAALARANRLCFFSSCFCPAEVDLLESLNVPAYKIASMDVNHIPLLEYVAAKGKPVLLSTGMATLGEIERALEALRGSGSVALLHCLSIYPAPANEINLLNISTLQTAFDMPTGYSDHTLGIAIPLAAVALGACIIEKHFTLDKRMEGWDHAISADPAELSALVRESRAIFDALGSRVRRVSTAEMEKRKVFRRRMVIKRAMRAGERLIEGDIDFKRPGTGIAPDELAYVRGRTLARDVECDHELEWSDIS
jgi:N,N'-diacetyllegionaminate synthase